MFPWIGVRRGVAHRAWTAPLIVALALGVLAQPVAAADKGSSSRATPAGEAASFIHGAPADASEAWTLAAGGRIYDNWWEALGRDKPVGTHPAYPATGKVSGPNTWRCKECHGWDYRGRDGDYATGSHATGIGGIRNAEGLDPAQIMRLLRAPLHGYSAAMIADEELSRVAAFVSKGQHDVSRLMDPATRQPLGDMERGKALFQTTCAACHGFDGKLLNWGTRQAPAFVGTEADAAPWEVLHKIRSSHPGAMMINMQALPVSDAMALLVYARTLPKQ